MSVNSSDVQIVSDIEGNSTPGLYHVDGQRLMVLPNDHSFNEFYRLAEDKVKRFVQRSLLEPLLEPLGDDLSTTSKSFVSDSVMYRKPSGLCGIVNPFREISLYRQFIGAFIRTEEPYGDMSKSEINIVRNSIKSEVLSGDDRGIRLGRDFIPSDSLITYATKVGATVTNLDSGLVNIGYLVRYSDGSFQTLEDFVVQFPNILLVFDKLIKRFPLCQIYSKDLPDFDHL